MENPAIIPVDSDARARRNVAILSLATALAGANAAVFFAISGLIGAMLAPSKTFATVPVSLYVVGLAAAALPVGWMVGRYGRRTTYIVATLFGVLAGLLNAAAIVLARFELLCLGAICVGAYAAAAQSYRFAAADTASEGYRPRAISLVLAGGVAAGILGPQLVIHTKELLMPHLFAATCLAQAVVALLACLVVMRVDIPLPVRSAIGGSARTAREIVSEPRFLIAVACGTAAYLTMNFAMTAAPLAMIGCNLSVDDAALGIQWHVIAMYGPGFFTGSLIARYGVAQIVGAGLILIMASALVGLHGTTLAHFWISLILLGLGWNFGYVGASTMVAACARPGEQSRVQAINDFTVFTLMAVASFASGAILHVWGWAMVALVTFVPAFLGLVVLIFGKQRALA